MGVWGQPDNDAIDIADHTREIAHTSAIVTRETSREHQAIRYRDARGESEGPKHSAESQWQGQEQRQGRLFF